MRKPKLISEVELGTVEWTDKGGMTELQPVLDVKIIPGLYTDPETIAYTWNITRWEGKALHIQLLFENPELISINEDPEKI